MSCAIILFLIWLDDCTMYNKVYQRSAFCYSDPLHATKSNSTTRKVRPPSKFGTASCVQSFEDNPKDPEKDIFTDINTFDRTKSVPKGNENKHNAELQRKPRPRINRTCYTLDV